MVVLWQVHNESYWYAMRHKLGPRRQMHHGIRMDKKKGMWEAYLYAQRVKCVAPTAHTPAVK